MSRCLFCLREDRPFTSVEHVVPEGLGNKEIILPAGVVCDGCNNGKLSDVDQKLVDFDPLALLRVKYAVPTKVGKMPKAQLGDALVQRTSPSHVHIKTEGNKTVWEVPGGHGFKFRGRRPLNARHTRELTRALFKIALELIYLEEGPDVAFAARFDPVREMVRGVAPFHGYLLIASNREYISQGHTEVSIQFRYVGDGDRQTVLIVFDFAGVVMATDLLTRNLDDFGRVPEGYSVAKF